MMNDSKAEGQAEGRREGALAVLAALVRDGVLSVREAALRVNMTEGAFEAEMKKLS